MVTRLHLSLLLCLFVFLLAVVQSHSVAVSQEVSGMPSANLVPNPGFEIIAGDGPADWSAGGPRGEITPAFSCDPVFRRSGASSFCMSGDGKTGVVGWTTAECPGITPDKSYELIAYARAEDIPSLHESAWVKISWLRAGEDDFPRVAYLNSFVQEGGWWRISGVLRAPAEAARAKITLGLRHAPQGRLWWDDVSLREVPTPPARRVRIATAYLPAEEHADPEAWRRLIVQAGEGKADIVCLGEMAQVVPEGFAGHPTIPGPATDALGELARQYDIMIVVSLREWQGPVWYNTAVIVGKDGRLVGRYRKTHLPQAEVEAGSTPGSTLPVFDTEIGRLGLQVCYDHFFPEVSRTLALKGAEIIFTPIWGDIRDDNAVHESVVRARAVDNSVYYVTSTYNERSFIVDPSGTILADTAGKPGVVFADIDLDEPHYERWLSVSGEAEFRYLWPKERRPALYESIAADR